MIASFNINPDSADAIQTCIGSMSGVSTSVSSGVLSVIVYPPFDSTRVDEILVRLLRLDPAITRI